MPPFCRDEAGIVCPDFAADRAEPTYRWADAAVVSRFATPGRMGGSAGEDPMTPESVARIVERRGEPAFISLLREADTTFVDARFEAALTGPCVPNLS
jgi:hypothetical protein